jgi:hypothetical protein
MSWTGDRHRPERIIDGTVRGGVFVDTRTYDVSRDGSRRERLPSRGVEARAMSLFASAVLKERVAEGI